MKTIRKEETIYRDVYVSIDGKEFRNADHCKEWEESYKGTISASVMNIDKIRVNGVSLGIPDSTYDSEVYALKPKNLEEITLLNAWINCRVCDKETRLTADMIGKEIVLNFGYDADWCDVFVLEKLLESIKKEIENVSVKLNAEKEDN